MERSIRLERLTSFGMGGAPLRYFRPADEAELRAALDECRRLGLAWRVLGGGSNLLVEEGALPFAVIHVCSPGLGRIERTGASTVRVGAGVLTASLLSYCREQGLGGLEFLAGVPGTVGGALAGNAGAWGREVSALLSCLCAISPQGGTRVIARSQLEFSYRSSSLAGHIITQAELELEPRSRELIALQTTRYARARTERHPLGEASAGCIFRNPPSHSAGRLLDLCGLKGHAVGNAQVSRRHANFIINRGEATAQQVLRLIGRMKEAVRRHFGIELELEVRHWPGDGRAA